METHFGIASLFVNYVRATRRHRRRTKIAPVRIAPEGMHLEKEDFFHCFHKCARNFTFRELREERFLFSAT